MTPPTATASEQQRIAQLEAEAHELASAIRGAVLTLDLSGEHEAVAYLTGPARITLARYDEAHV